MLCMNLMHFTISNKDYGKQMQAANEFICCRLNSHVLFFKIRVQLSFEKL